MNEITRTEKTLYELKVTRMKDRRYCVTEKASCGECHDGIQSAVRESLVIKLIGTLIGNPDFAPDRVTLKMEMEHPVIKYHMPEPERKRYMTHKL